MKPPKVKGTGIAASSADKLFTSWLVGAPEDIQTHRLVPFTEVDGERDAAIDEIRKVAENHYVLPEVMAKRLADLGAPATAELLREHLPTAKRARSGDLGEILATEYAERQLGFHVPVRRLRWKDGREMALRGDDVVAIQVNNAGKLLCFLKGESKSRAFLGRTVVNQAAGALDRDGGRPSRHSVMFVADRLREAGQDELATSLEKAVLASFKGQPVEHLLFTVSGNTPASLLRNHLTAYTKANRRHAIGVRITNHGEFIRLLFEGF